MAFESIAEYIDQVEEGFGRKESPASIAKRLGIPEKAKTIRRYKIAVWDLKDLVAESKEERAANHDSRRESAKIEIIKSLDLIDKIKMRAWQHLDWQVGDEYGSVNENGQPVKRKASPGQVINWHHQATDMAAKALKAELELAGDDPTSRMAGSIESLSEAEADARLKELLTILNETRSDQSG
ncbi:MAG: hypothetical protein WC343_09170 [Bacilli bacterium]|jgi:hypothetical protein